MGKRELITCLRRLNKHFNRKVKFRTGYPHCEAEGPACYPPTATLMFPPYNAFYDKRVLAHEYAHIIDADNRVLTLESSHDEKFESVYREVCLAAGARYTPTKRLWKIIETSYNKEKRAARDSNGQTKSQQDLEILLKQLATGGRASDSGQNAGGEGRHPPEGKNLKGGEKVNNYTKEELAVIQKITEDVELIEVGRKAIEDTLVDRRDSCIFVAVRGNGLVVREKDGEGSAIIRMGPEEAIRIGLRAIIKVLSKSEGN